jgi:tetrahydromethanopterin S-methyltransferase subunit G
MIYSEYNTELVEIYRQLEVINEQLDVVGNEGLKNIITRIGNTFGSIFNTFVTITTKLHKTTKRGELKWYKESNLFTVKQIYKLSYTELVHVNLPIPRGMKSDYLEYTNTLESSLEYINMESTVRLLEMTIKDIHDTILEGNGDISQIIKNANNLIDNKVTAKIQKDMSKVDNPKYKEKEKTYGDLFKSTNEFNDLLARLIDMEKYYDQTNRIIKKLDTIEKYMQNIIDSKDIEKVTKSDLQTLSNLAYTYAKSFDIYGMLVYNLQRVEHNFVECMKTIALQKHIG